MLEIGSFYVTHTPNKTHLVSRVFYKPEHRREYDWFFINSEDIAVLFAKHKTRIDNKLLKNSR